jgi:hypothetical protein
LESIVGRIFRCGRSTTSKEENQQNDFISPHKAKQCGDNEKNKESVVEGDISTASQLQ